jgi:hypothetical protein
MPDRVISDGLTGSSPQESGDARPDIAPNDLSAILVGALAMQAHAGGSAPSAHLVDVACDALRPH